MPSLHDNVLVSYEVSCHVRRIKLCTQRPNSAEKHGARTVVFSSVEGYHFEYDAFGNIISSLEEVAVEQLLSKHGAEIAKSYRIAGAPGPWAGDLASAAQVLTAKGTMNGK